MFGTRGIVPKERYLCGDGGSDLLSDRIGALISAVMGVKIGAPSGAMT